MKINIIEFLANAVRIYTDGIDITFYDQAKYFSEIITYRAIDISQSSNSVTVKLLPTRAWSNARYVYCFNCGSSCGSCCPTVDMGRIYDPGTLTLIIQVSA